MWALWSLNWTEKQIIMKQSTEKELSQFKLCLFNLNRVALFSFCLNRTWATATAPTPSTPTRAMSTTPSPSKWTTRMWTSQTPLPSPSSPCQTFPRPNCPPSLCGPEWDVWKNPAKMLPSRWLVCGVLSVLRNKCLFVCRISFFFCWFLIISHDIWYT